MTALRAERVYTALAASNLVYWVIGKKLKRLVNRISNGLVDAIFLVFPESCPLSVPGPSLRFD